MIYTKAVSEGNITDNFKAINIACEEKMTLPETLKAITQFAIGESIPLVNYTKQRDTLGYCNKFYPSVDCGPISVERLKDLLPGFSPISLNEALQKSVSFCV